LEERRLAAAAAALPTHVTADTASVPQHSPQLERKDSPIDHDFVVIEVAQLAPSIAVSTVG